MTVVNLLKSRFILVLFILAFLILAAAMGQQNQTDNKPEQIDRLLSPLVLEPEPGLAALVIKDGRVFFERTYGITDLRSRQPITSQTNFRLASVSKQFTATAIMLLIRDGKLSYDTRLTDVFPAFPEYGQAITIRHLLQHTSGLPNYEDLMPLYDGTQPVEEVQISDDQVLSLLQQQRAGQFEPGSRWAYSNSGYVLLGLAVAKISGQPFSEFLRQRIFTPLGMINTLAYVRGKNEVPNRAYGHTKKDNHWVETDQSPTSATLGDGGIYSSLADLAKWDEALRQHTLLTEAELQLALTPVEVAGKGPEEPDGTAAAYGFGWFLNPWQGHQRMWHYGETRGFRTAIQRFPKDRLTIIILANRSDLDARDLSLRIARLILNDSQDLRSAGVRAQQGTR